MFHENHNQLNDQFRHTRVPFGGVWNDIKRRYPHYLSDFKDGLNGQTLSATIFIYFACLSGAIAFGGLLGEKTRGLIGIPETIIVSCIAGLFFALGLNSIASQQTFFNGFFKRVFYISVGHPVVLKTLLKSLLKSLLRFN